ncbi:low temperature requirement protein A [Actinomycetospora endophytica]|uniref:Low temperature requirement protein A n=1 Tax=Actinomycetospora endophytica TaxID=2291215 RepID=A0ABS8P528_9PSEU|nr:low temperature requirement protein A [Actinomycetospora endophytica]MCD2193365.1 low temperature requirement protein A [Actinomycetospora endophytica]
MTSPRTEWYRPMTARNPYEEHRASSPLELLFDLTFVVAISSAAAELHHAISEDHILAGGLGYLVVFFAIWWAWINFTWFASAYDCDDALYRVLTVLKMAGVLVLAVGIPAAFEHFDIGTVVLGYTIMRIAMIALWLRAAHEDPARAPVTRVYAAGLAVIQLLWIGLVFVPTPWSFIGFVVLVICEVSLPPFAESRETHAMASATGGTTWHAEHIAERYGLLTLIVLGEVILGITGAFGPALSERGFSISLLLLGIGGLLVVVGLWWVYFLAGDDEGLTTQRVAFLWGYGHYVVFAGVAAVGAGLEVAVDAEEHTSHISTTTAAFAVAIPIALVLLVLTGLRRLTWAPGSLAPGWVAFGVVGVLVCAALAGVVGIGLSVLLMGLVGTVMLIGYLLLLRGRELRAS